MFVKLKITKVTVKYCGFEQYAIKKRKCLTAADFPLPFPEPNFPLSAQVGCSGSELKVQDKEVNLAKSGLKFDVKVN